MPISYFSTRLRVIAFLPSSFAQPDYHQRSVCTHGFCRDPDISANGTLPPPLYLRTHTFFQNALPERRAVFGGTLPCRHARDPPNVQEPHCPGLLQRDLPARSTS